MALTKRKEGSKDKIWSKSCDTNTVFRFLSVFCCSWFEEWLNVWYFETDLDLYALVARKMVWKCPSSLTEVSPFACQCRINIVRTFAAFLSVNALRWDKHRFPLLTSPEKRVPRINSVTIREYFKSCHAIMSRHNSAISYLATLRHEQCGLSLVRGAYQLTKNPGSFALVIFSNFRGNFAVIFRKIGSEIVFWPRFEVVLLSRTVRTVGKFFLQFPIAHQGKFNYKRQVTSFGRFLDLRKIFYHLSTVIPTGVLFFGIW